MSLDYIKILKKLDRPPSGPNWARFVHSDVNRTAKSIVKFGKGLPPMSYTPGYAAIKDRLQLGIDLDTAVRAVQRSGSPFGRKPNEDFVRAFFAHDEQRRYRARGAIEFEKEHFRVSREINVPVSPLSVIHENGNFVPLFVCGWSKVDLDIFQRRLLVTIFEDAFLSLTDFQKSPAEFLFFPKISAGTSLPRETEIWKRGDYQLLSGAQLDDAVEIFLHGRSIARQLLLDEMAESSQARDNEIVNTSVEVPYDLFNR